MKKGLLLFQTLLLGSVLPVMAQQVKPNLPWVDISSDRGRQIVLSEGTPELYNGHPTTVMLDDNKFIVHGASITEVMPDYWQSVKIRA